MARSFLTPAALPLASTVNGELIGYRGVPAVQQNTNFTFTSAYAGLCVYKDTTTAYTYTVPDGLPNGTVLVVANMAASGNITISMSGSEVLRLAGTTTTGSRTVGAWGEATLHKVAGIWLCAGPGVT